MLGRKQPLCLQDLCVIRLLKITHFIEITYHCSCCTKPRTIAWDIATNDCINIRLCTQFFIAHRKRFRYLKGKK